MNDRCIVEGRERGFPDNDAHYISYKSPHASLYPYPPGSHHHRHRQARHARYTLWDSASRAPIVKLRIRDKTKPLSKIIIFSSTSRHGQCQRVRTKTSTSSGQRLTIMRTPKMLNLYYHDIQPNQDQAQ